MSSNVLSAKNIVDKYYANLLAALLLAKAEDKQSIQIIKQPSGKTMKTQASTENNPVLKWAIYIHNDKFKEFKDLADADQKELKKINQRILHNVTKEVHWPLATNPLKIDWNTMMDAVRVISLRIDRRDFKLNKVRDVLENWDTAEKNEINVAFNSVYYYLNRADNDSQLLQHLRRVSTKILSQFELERKKEEEEAIKEDADAGTTSAGSIGAPPDIRDGRKIHKRIKKFQPINRIKKLRISNNKKKKKLKIKQVNTEG